MINDDTYKSLPSCLIQCHCPFRASEELLKRSENERLFVNRASAQAAVDPLRKRAEVRIFVHNISADGDLFLSGVGGSEVELNEGSSPTLVELRLVAEKTARKIGSNVFVPSTVRMKPQQIGPKPLRLLLVVNTIRTYSNQSGDSLRRRFWDAPHSYCLAANNHSG
jgi:hypothetical protein